MCVRACVCVLCTCVRACVRVCGRERGRESSFDEHRSSFDLIYFERKRLLLITGEAQINLHYCYSRQAESQREDWLQTPSLGKSTEREGERGTERDWKRGREERARGERVGAGGGGGYWPTTIRVKSKPLRTAFLCTWSGSVANPMNSSSSCKHTPHDTTHCTLRLVLYGKVNKLDRQLLLIHQLTVNDHSFF